MEAITAAIGTAKMVYGIAKTYDNAELMMQVNTLIQQLTEARLENLEISGRLIEFRNENARLSAKIAELENVDSPSLQLANGVYWKGEGRRKGTEDGPYCAACYSRTRKVVPMASAVARFYLCPVCQATAAL